MTSLILSRQKTREQRMLTFHERINEEHSPELKLLCLRISDWDQSNNNRLTICVNNHRVLMGWFSFSFRRWMTKRTTTISCTRNTTSSKRTGFFISKNHFECAIFNSIFCFRYIFVQPHQIQISETVLVDPTSQARNLNLKFHWMRINALAYWTWWNVETVTYRTISHT